MAASEIRGVNNNTLDFVRAKAIEQVLYESKDALKSKGTANYSLDSLEITINFLHQLFSPHHSEFYLEKVKKIRLILDGEKIDPINNIFLGVVEGKRGRIIKARWLMEWFGLISKYLFPHENLGDIKEGSMRRGFYEDKLLAKFNLEEKRRREKAIKQFKKQKRKGIQVDKVVFDV